MFDKIETKCVQAGYSPKNGEPRALPIFQSTTFKYDNSDHMGDIFDMKAEGHLYSRISNPTNEALAAKIAAVCGGKGAIVTSSGQAATMISAMTLCGAGDRILAASALYGGSLNLFGHTLSGFGVSCDFFDVDADDGEIEKLITPATKAMYVETIANPSLRVADISRMADIAHRHGMPLVVDNTFATPILCRPIEYGADIVTISTSKYFDGNGTALGGAVVDSGKFDWNNGRYPMLSKPDESFHGVSFTEKFGDLAYIGRAMNAMLRDSGACASPFNSFIIFNNMCSLHVRMERHCKNALAAAELIKASGKVDAISYPALEGDRYKPLADRYLGSKGSGVVSFDFGTKKQASAFLDSLRLAAVVTHVADSHTCALHPAGTTHRQLSDEALKKGGINPGTVRLSVGLEATEDILEDLSSALAKV
ncbi:MAG: O-acetylhomoserine aminocarboxypropyltransferase/cysteine synthase [Clostridia bacterium]|nr:O-acetylhomoserine aminocarboxypropyltransferase/cysteine synthase [Clostridia bacterium]